ncbi:hypothetical protein [Pseudoduganella violaceinigra]|uniref:hypothetical protein n=1 Tax=Pseudoduganella violaceinigra TaxID=246602 RepID=UPI0004206775|nr:hypothetical protein [Pseudoduganella violaceinigra]
MRPILLALLAASTSASAANCHLDELSDGQRYNFSYQPAYFDSKKSYELDQPFTVKSGDQLAYRKLGRRHLYLVPETNVTYKPDWFLAITFRLKAGQKYRAEVNAQKGGPSYVIRESGGAGVSQFLYVTDKGELCERVGSYRDASGGMGALTTLVKGVYAAEPAEPQLKVVEEVDPNYSRALSVTLEDQGPAIVKLTLNVFGQNGVERTTSKQFDRNALDDVQFEGWRFALKRQPDGSYQARVLSQPG